MYYYDNVLSWTNKHVMTVSMCYLLTLHLRLETYSLSTTKLLLMISQRLFTKSERLFIFRNINTMQTIRVLLKFALPELPLLSGLELPTWHYTQDFNSTFLFRETGSIERHADALVTLLESCLCHSLAPSVKDEDPPHAKIASDVLSCIFLVCSQCLFPQLQYHINWNVF